MIGKRRIYKIVEKAAKVGSDLADIVIHLRGRPTIISGIAVASRLIDSYNHVTQPDPAAYFEGWQRLDIEPFTHGVIAMCSGQRCLVEDDPTSSGRLMVAEIHGARIGWIQHDRWIQGPWHAEENEEHVRGLVARFIWESHGSHLLLVQTMMGISIEPDLLSESFQSHTAEKLHGELDLFLKAGHARAILLHGEPGTGKTHVMRQVAKLAGGYTIRVKARDMDRVSDLGRALQLLHPSALLIDDIDRAEHREALLDAVENVRVGTRLFMATANDVSLLDRAMLRPGRFDMVIEIDKLDRDVLKNIMKQFPKSIRSKAKKLPIAYLDELRKIVDVHGPKRAIAEIDKLQERFEKVSNAASGSGEGKVPTLGQEDATK